MTATRTLPAHAIVVSAETFEVDGVVFEKQFSRTAHTDPNCSHVGTIVAIDVPFASADAGLPCEWCAVEALPFMRDPAEVDAPAPRRGNGTGRGTAQPTKRTNRYAGACAKCGGWVEAEAGILAGRPGAWTVEHDGECPKVEAPAPVAAPAAPVVTAVEGMHRVDPTGVEGAKPSIRATSTVIYKCQRSRETGNLYAKRLVQHEGGGWEFIYAPGAVKLLSAATLMSIDEAKEFGALYGVCCVCGATLTDETSIALGIGPVCGSRMTEWATGTKLTQAQWTLYDEIREAGTMAIIGRRAKTAHKLVDAGLVVVDRGIARVAS